MFKKIFLISTLQISLSFANELEYSENFNECYKNANSIVELKKCASNEYELYENIFKIEYEKTMERANDQQKKDFKKNQELWLKFIESTCTLENSLDSEYGRSNYYGCKNNELKKRIEQIKEFFTFLP